MTRKEKNAFETPLRPHLRDAAPYPPGKPIEEVRREYGLTRVVKLASNENPLGPSPRAVKAMKAAAGEMNLYPDGGGYYLKRALAEKLNVAPEEIALGNGSDELTLLLALCYLGPKDNIATSEFAFVRYRMNAKLVGGKARLTPMKNFRHDIDALADAVNDSTRIVFLDNPCNPTGAMTTRRELNRLLRRVPRRVLVLVDEAYCEYAVGDPNYPDSLALRRRHPNLIITRTFSKAYGLAGLRIGYGVARPEIVADLERVRPPFNANRMAQAAAIAALDDAEHLRRSVETNREGLVYLSEKLGELGVGVVTSRANFVLADFEPAGKTGAEIYDALLGRGIVVRPMAGYGLTHHARISVGRPTENRALIRALKPLLA